MNLIKNFSAWVKAITESSKNKYEYGCAMIFYSFPEVYKMQDAIDPDDIYTEEGDNTYGLEDEPHTTLLFGFHSDVNADDVLYLCNKFDYSEDLILTNVSCFNNEKYDVLKFDVESPVLHRVNSKLKVHFENKYTSNFPDYHPHCTIGYIKKGKGQHYVDLFKDLSFSVTPTKIVYSMPDGGRKQISLKD